MKSLVTKSLLSIVILSASMIGCGKKDSDSSDAAPAPNGGGTPIIQIADGVDSRLFGTWLLDKIPLKDKKTGKEIPGINIVPQLIVSKEKFSVVSELMMDGVVKCKVEATATKFAITSDKIEILENVEKEVVSEKTRCSIALQKGQPFVYQIQSDDELLLLSESDGNKIAKRVK